MGPVQCLQAVTVVTVSGPPIGCHSRHQSSHGSCNYPESQTLNRLNITQTSRSFTGQISKYVFIRQVVFAIDTFYKNINSTTRFCHLRLFCLTSLSAPLKASLSSSGSQPLSSMAECLSLISPG